MNDIGRLESCFQPLERRTPPQTLFFRVIGRDAGGQILALLERWRLAAEESGACLLGLENPTRGEICRFRNQVGEQFELDAGLFERQITLCLGQVRAPRRPFLAAALLEVLRKLQTQGANDYILKNVYTKFMCWLRGPLGSVCARLGSRTPPKILFLGDISRHETFFLRLLCQAGCDVCYVHFLSAASYDKADPEGKFSQMIAGELRTVPDPPFVVVPPEWPRSGPQRTAAPKVQKQTPEPAPVPRPAPPPWENAGKDLCLNRWIEDRPVWDALLLPYDQRGEGRASVFALLLGADERGVYRNRLFHLRRALDAGGRSWILQTEKPRPPAPSETEAFRLPSGLSQTETIRGLAERLPAGKPWTRLAQRALTLALESSGESNGSRFYNHAVRLACWLRRYAEKLFQKEGTAPPVFLYYGPIAAPEISLLWCLAQMGADVLYVSPEKTDAFQNSALPRIWMEAVFENELPLEPFPQREEKIRARTTAYYAERELDNLLYNDTGMFRNRQFARSQPVTLRTTWDEVGQLWPEEAQVRPSFRTEEGVVYVPNLFSKICGVDGDLNLYWDRVRTMITPQTWVVTALPFLQDVGVGKDAVKSCLHNGRLDPNALARAPFYRYGYLPQDTQDYMMEKMQALIDYDLITDGGPDLPASILSVLLDLDRDLLRLVQGFDFTRTVPKLLVVDVSETLFSLEECILLAFLNLVGFDIAVFTPTGYRNLETHIRLDSFDTLNIGAFAYDLRVPDLRGRRPGGKGFLNRLLFGD